MWLNPKTKAVAYTNMQARMLCPGWSAPIDPSDDMIMSQGFVPVTRTAPSYDPVTQSAIELAPSKQGDGTWQQQWKVVELYASTAERDAAVAAHMARLTADLSEKIDSAVAAVCAGPQRFIAEYQEREAQARAYVNDCGASHAVASIPVPSRIAAFANAAKMAPYQAALLTVAQADALRGALGKLADLRMRKYEVKRQATAAAAQALCDEILLEVAAVILP